MTKFDDYQWLFRKAPAMATSIAEDGSTLELGKGERSSYSMMLGIAMGEKTGDDSRV